MTDHANYPHHPGTLYDCPACEEECFCDADSEPCVHCADHMSVAVNEGPSCENGGFLSYA